MHAFDKTDGQTEFSSLYRDCIPCSAVKIFSWNAIVFRLMHFHFVFPPIRRLLTTSVSKCKLFDINLCKGVRCCRIPPLEIRYCSLKVWSGLTAWLISSSIFYNGNYVWQNRTCSAVTSCLRALSLSTELRSCWTLLASAAIRNAR